MNRAYSVKRHANTGKRSAVVETVRASRKTAEKIARVQWRCFYETGQFHKNLDIKRRASLLSERYKQTCQYQVVGTLKSFIRNRQNDFVDLVKRSPLDETTRHKLLIINAFGLWQRTAPFTSMKHKLQIDTADLKLARRLFKHVVSRHRKPSFKRVNMALDNKVAVISSKVLGKAKTFDYWIRLSTIDKGAPSYIPLSTNEYFENTPGARRNFCQVNLSEDNEISVFFIKDVPKNPYVPETSKIALDLGLATLLATDRGDLTGRGFFEVLKGYDLLISGPASKRQNHGLKVRSRTYDNLVNTVREFMKNEINRVLNRIVDIYKPAEIVVERLDFRSPELSRRMNRVSGLMV
jgi:putative transposase